MEEPCRTVLVVDDDADIRDVLRMLCEAEGYRVVGEAAHGAEALPLALRHRPDVVILDFLMPRMDGARTARILKAVSPESKIVAFSAVLEAEPDWCDSFLNKERIVEIAPLLERLI